MEALKQRIRQEGKILPGNIVKVDSFLNHQVDARFLGQLAEEFGRRFDISRCPKRYNAAESGPGHPVPSRNRAGIFEIRRYTPPVKAHCARRF